MASLNFVLKVIMTVVCLILCSLFFIFAYDLTTQSGLFRIREINISGIHRLTRDEVLDQAGVGLGDNIFAVNLGVVAKRLKGHDWIRDLSIRRELPGCLSINIQEQQPLAVAEMGPDAHLMMNTRGEPFMLISSWEQRGESMPVVRGLALTRGQAGYGFSGPLYQGVMEILTLGERAGHLIDITADEDAGINVRTSCFPAPGLDDTPEKILLKLGFDKFESKYERAGKIGRYVADNFSGQRIFSMDLFHVDSVTVKLKDKDALPEPFKGGV